VVRVRPLRSSCLARIDYEPTFRELNQSKVEQIACGGWVISATAELRNLGASKLESFYAAQSCATKLTRGEDFHLQH